MPPHEIELKFSLTDDDLARVGGHPIWLGAGAGAGTVEQLISVYYDTAEHALKAKGLTLRIRSIGDRRIQTVKSADGPGLFGRGEWECDVAGDAPDLDAALLTPLAKVLDEEAFALVQPVFLTHIARSSRTVAYEGAEIEVCLDRGEIETQDGRTSSLNELELELKSGEPGALLSLARALGGGDPLRLSLVSKAEAGYRLADGMVGYGVKAQPPKLGGARTAGDGFQRIGRACLQQLNANEAGVMTARAPEAVHQMRVALRRLRAAISTFKAVAADDRLEQIKTELKWVSDELNDARNLDVLIVETYRPYVAEAVDGERGVDLQALGAALSTAQTRAYDRAAAAVASARYRTLVLQTAAWMEVGPWLTGMANAGVRDRKLERFAADALQRRLKSMRKKARDLQDADAEGRHAFRIAAKKMRYTAELLSDLYSEAKPAKRRDRFIAALKLLQDDLGVLNDLATAQATVLLAVAPAKGAKASPQAGFAAGLMVGQSAAQHRDLLKHALAAARDFSDAVPFW